MLEKRRTKIKKTLLGFSKQVLAPGAKEKIGEAKRRIFGKPPAKERYKKVVKGWKTVNVKRKGKWVQEKRPILKRVKVKIKKKTIPRRTGRGFVGY